MSIVAPAKDIELMLTYAGASSNRAFGNVPAMLSSSNVLSLDRSFTTLEDSRHRYLPSSLIPLYIIFSCEPGIGSPRHFNLPVAGSRRGRDSAMESLDMCLEVKRRSTQSLCVVEILRADSQRCFGSSNSKICSQISGGKNAMRVVLDLVFCSLLAIWAIVVVILS